MVHAIFTAVIYVIIIHFNIMINLHYYYFILFIFYIICIKYIPLKLDIEQVDYSYYKRVLTYQERIEEMDDTELTKKIYNYVMHSNENFGYRRMIATIQKKTKWRGPRYMVCIKN